MTAVENTDALDWLRSLPDASVDAVVTDPPYVIGAVSAGNIGAKSGGWADMMNSALWFSAWYAEAWRVLKDDGCFWTFCNWRSLPVVMRSALDAKMPITSLLVWDKEWIGPGGPKGLRPSYELVALSAKPGFAIPNRGLPDIWRHKTGGHKPNGHPAEKPVGLVERILRESGLDPDALVIDPFTGSGTTGVASANLGLNFRGSEAESQWCDLANRRIDEARLVRQSA